MIRLWDKKFRKRNISILLCMGLFAGCLSGCGGEYAGVTGEDAVSGGAVSGSAVSGSAISDKDMDGKAVSGSAIGKEQAADGSGEKREQDMSGHRFCSDTNLYYEEEGAIIQARLDGTHKTCILESRKDVSIWVHYVDGDWLYYEVWEEDDDRDMLYRAPIRKDAAGYDIVSISDGKKLFAEDLMFPASGMDSRYFFYSLDGEYVKYDLQKRRKIIKDVDTYCDDTQIFQINDHYIMGTDGGDLFVQGINDEEWTEVSKDNVNLSSMENMVQGERAVFYPRYLNEDEDDYDLRFRIRKYDGEKETDFLTWEQIKKTVSEAEDLGPGELEFADWDGLFWQGGRLYIQVQVGWEKDGIYHEEYMILSRAEREDGSGLRYERQFTECMRSHVKTRKGKWCDIDDEDGGEKRVFVDHMVVNGARCIAMVNGKAYLSLYDEGKDKGHLGCYELNTGKFQWVDREDRLFYEIGYDYELSEFITVYDNYLDNEFTPFWHTPSADKEADGKFVEE